MAQHGRSATSGPCTGSAAVTCEPKPEPAFEPKLLAVGPRWWPPSPLLHCSPIREGRCQCLPHSAFLTAPFDHHHHPSATSPNGTASHARLNGFADACWQAQLRVLGRFLGEARWYFHQHSGCERASLSPARRGQGSPRHGRQRCPQGRRRRATGEGRSEASSARAYARIARPNDGVVRAHHGCARGVDGDPQHREEVDISPHRSGRGVVDITDVKRIRRIVVVDASRVEKARDRVLFVLSFSSFPLSVPFVVVIPNPPCPLYLFDIGRLPHPRLHRPSTLLNRGTRLPHIPAPVRLVSPVLPPPPCSATLAILPTARTLFATPRARVRWCV